MIPLRLTWFTHIDCGSKLKSIHWNWSFFLSKSMWLCNWCTSAFKEIIVNFGSKSFIIIIIILNMPYKSTILMIILGVVCLANGLRRKYEITEIHPGKWNDAVLCASWLLLKRKLLYVDHPGKCWWDATKTAYAINESFTDQSTCEPLKCEENLQFVRTRSVNFVDRRSSRYCN